MMFSTWATISSVRFSEAPSGSRSAAKNAPWSSAGRKPCGVILNSPTEAAATAATATRPNTATRTSRRTIAGIAVAHAVDAAQHVAHRPARRLPPRFSSTEQSAGLRVSALIAEISIDTDTATANCRNSWPLIPGMKRHRHEHRQQHQRDRDDRRR